MTEHIVDCVNGEWICSCGKPVEEQYDHYGIYCGRMCEEKFKQTYRQDAYADDGYCEPLEEI